MEPDQTMTTTTPWPVTLQAALALDSLTGPSLCSPSKADNPAGEPGPCRRIFWTTSTMWTRATGCCRCLLYLKKCVRIRFLCQTGSACSAHEPDGQCASGPQSDKDLVKSMDAIHVLPLLGGAPEASWLAHRAGQMLGH